MQVQGKRLQTIRDFQQFPEENGLLSSEPKVQTIGKESLGKSFYPTTHLNSYTVLD